MFCESDSGEILPISPGSAESMSLRPCLNQSLTGAICASWLTTSLTCVPADVRRPSAAVLHLPRDSAGRAVCAENSIRHIGELQSVRGDPCALRGIDCRVKRRVGSSQLRVIHVGSGLSAVGHRGRKIFEARLRWADADIARPLSRAPAAAVALLERYRRNHERE